MDGCGHSKSVHHIVMSMFPGQHTEKMQNEKNHLLCNISLKINDRGIIHISS